MRILVVIRFSTLISCGSKAKIEEIVAEVPLSSRTESFEKKSCIGEN